MRYWLFCAFLFIFPSLALAVQINEIMYDPAASDSYAEWIELYNNESTEINLTGWFLCDKEILAGYVNKSDGVTYNATNLTLPSGAYAIITDGGTGSTVLDNFIVNSSAWLFHIDGSEMCTNGLSNAGETITLNMSDGSIYDSVAYTDIAPQNYSIERTVNDTLQVSLTLGGTPGSPNSASGGSGITDYNLTVNAFPTSLAFGAQSFVNITFSAGSYNFSKIRIVAYARQTPSSGAYIAIDNTSNKIYRYRFNASNANESYNITQDKNITTNLTFDLESNCGSDTDPVGNYYGIVEVYNFTGNETVTLWEEIQTSDFSFSVSANQNCPASPPAAPPSSGGGSSSSSTTSSPSISIDITKHLRIGEDFEIEALIFNSLSVAKEIEVYSYIYRSDGSTEYANTGGPTANKQTIKLKPNSKTSVKLTNTIKPDAEGIYILKVRVKDGTKNYDGTESIKLEKLPATEAKVSVEVERNETQENPAPSGLTGFFLGLGGNKTGNYSNISGAIIGGVGNFISSIVSGIINLISSVLASIGLRF